MQPKQEQSFQKPFISHEEHENVQENGLRNSFLCVNTLRRTSSNVCYLQTKRLVFCGRCQKANTVNGNAQKIHWEKSF